MNAEADTSFSQRQYDRDYRDRGDQQWSAQQFRQAEQAMELIIQSLRTTLQLQASALRACADGLQAQAQNLEIVERNMRPGISQGQRNSG